MLRYLITPIVLHSTATSKTLRLEWIVQVAFIYLAYLLRLLLPLNLDPFRAGSFRVQNFFFKFVARDKVVTLAFMYNSL